MYKDSVLKCRELCKSNSFVTFLKNKIKKMRKHNYSHICAADL